jgi:carbonic anhydrase
MQSFIFITVLLSIVHRTICDSWDYHALGPDVWSDTYPSCANHSQSPINIQTACTTYQSFTPFHFTSAYDLTNNFTLVNNGHTIVGTYIGNASSALTLTGGGLNGTYNLRNFHLHWGENYKSGSEHQV